MGSGRGKVHEARLELHRTKGRIHARSVAGRYNTLRWAVVWLTQIVFYGLCWLQWTGSNGPRQAVWFDIPGRKLYLFDLVLWPQDAMLLTLVLVISAVALFLATALLGRVFCGFACPQTVYTQIFTWIEARVEGDHLERMQRDLAPPGVRKFARKALKHALWWLVAAWTAITFVGYFTPIRDLLVSIAQLSPGPWETFWLVFYAGFTYVQAGLAREMVCQHMCPYSRFQSAMLDDATRVVSYDARRGEPRGSLRSAQPKGDCVDCGLCVQVCPTGIDIRNGLQYECINCGLCIDACDGVMDRIDRPRGLIRFASANELAGTPTARAAGGVFRPRIAVYAGLLCLAVGLLLWSVIDRSLLEVNVLRDRNALSREMADGRVANVYVLKLANLDERPHRYRVQVEGLPGLRIDGAHEFGVTSGSVASIPVTVSALVEGLAGSLHAIRFSVVSSDRPEIRSSSPSSFIAP